MSANKKQVYFRRKTIIGQNIQHIPNTDKMKILTNHINNVFLSIAFDRIFNMQRRKSTVIKLNDKKVDTALLSHLLSNNTANLCDIRSRSQLNRVQKSTISRSRTQFRRRKTIMNPNSPIKYTPPTNPFKVNQDTDSLNLFNSQDFMNNNLKIKINDQNSQSNMSIGSPTYLKSIFQYHITFRS